MGQGLGMEKEGHPGRVEGPSSGSGEGRRGARLWEMVGSQGLGMWLERWYSKVSLRTYPPSLLVVCLSPLLPQVLPGLCPWGWARKAGRWRWGEQGGRTA